MKSETKQNIVFTYINKGRDYTEEWMYENFGYTDYEQVRADLDRFMVEAQDNCENHKWLCERAGMFVSHYRCIKCGSYDVKNDPCVDGEV